LTVKKVNVFFPNYFKLRGIQMKAGFTLVEILIVVVILGILAAIVIPQFTDAATEAQMSSLTSDLQTVRAQIELFKIQHNDELPGTIPDGAVVSFEDSMTKYTVKGGALADPQEPSPGVNYGPYLQKMPTNPFDDSDVVEINGTVGGGESATPPVGWNYNTTTGAFHADTTDHISY
jgi:general secretion pathway protein G